MKNRESAKTILVVYECFALCIDVSQCCHTICSIETWYGDSTLFPIREGHKRIV